MRLTMCGTYPDKHSYPNHIKLCHTIFTPADPICEGIGGETAQRIKCCAARFFAGDVRYSSSNIRRSAKFARTFAETDS